MNLEPVLHRAKQIAKTQGRLANSPAEFRSSGVLDLCAGSCLARAILEISNDLDLLADFERLLLTEEKLAFIPYVFQKHGFSADSARRAVLENDSRSEAERMSWFTSLHAL